MADRRFKPGHRQNPQLRGTGKMSDARRAWLRTAIGQFVMLVFDDNEHPDADAEVQALGPTIRLYHPQPGRRAVSLDLTALTEDELNKTREFFNLLFDEAEPIVKMRDKVAHDALATGDDSYARSYRQLPQLIVRARKEREHDQGVQVRPPGVPPSDGGCEAGGVQRAGDGLASDEPRPDGSEDDGEAAN